jgi:hypothetical protein
MEISQYKHAISPLLPRAGSYHKYLQLVQFSLYMGHEELWGKVGEK